EHLLRGALADAALLLRQLLQRRRVGGRAPQPRGYGLLLDLLEPRRDAGLAEIFLRQHVGGDLRPEARHLDLVGMEHDRAVGIANLARGQPELDARVGRLSLPGVAPLDPHPSPLHRWHGSPRGLAPSYKLPACYPRRDPGLRPRPDWLVFVCSTPRPAALRIGPGSFSARPARSSVEARQSLSPAPSRPTAAVPRRL